MRYFLPHCLGYKLRAYKLTLLILMSPEPSEKYVALRIKIKHFSNKIAIAMAHV